MWHLLQHTKKNVSLPKHTKFHGNWVLDTITHIITYHHQRGMNTFIKDKYTPTSSNEHSYRQKDMVTCNLNRAEDVCNQYFRRSEDRL